MAFNPRAIIGPVSATDLGISRFDGSSGLKLQDTTSVIITDDGYLGIGTVNPPTLLSIAGAISIKEGVAPSSVSGYGLIYTKTADPALYFKGHDGVEHNVISGSIVGPGPSVDNAVVRFNGTSGTLLDQSGMFILDSGFVGIGTTNPAAIFHIKEDQNSATISLIENATSGINASAYYSVISQNNAIKGIANSDGLIRSYPGFHPGSVILLANATGGLNISSGLGSGTAGSGTGYIRFITDTVDLTGLTSGNDSRTRMVIDPLGKVGIGTTTPANKLVVQTSLNGDGLSINNANAGQSVGLYISTATTGQGQIGIAGSPNEWLSGSSAGDLCLDTSSGGLALGTNNSTKIYVSTSGFVGIGTTSPSAKLAISNSSDFSLALQNTGTNGNNWLLSNVAGVGAAGGLTIVNATSSLERLRIDNSGNVGIGTSVASTKVHMFQNTSGTSAFQIENANSGLNASSQIILAGPGGAAGFSYQTSSTVSNLNDRARLYGQSGTSGVSIMAEDIAGDIRFVTAGAQDSDLKMLIGANGNVGIGTTILSAQLVVKSVASQDIINIFDNTTNVFSIIDGGNVGVGTATPQSKFHIRNDIDAESELVLENQHSGSSASQAILVGPEAITGPTRYAKFAYQNSTDTSSLKSFGAGGLSIEANAGDISLATASTERMRITSTGNIGIGNTSPSSIVDIVASGSSTDVSLTAYRNSSGQTSVSGSFARGTLLSPIIVNSNDVLFKIFAKGYDGNAFQSAASLELISSTTPGSNSMPGAVVLKTSAVGSTTPTERMRISHDGSVGIGTTAPASTLHVAGSLSNGITFISTDATLGMGDYTIFVDATTTINITLPLSATCKGRRYEIKKTDSTSGTMSVISSGSDLIDGSSSISTDVPFESFTFISDGSSNWYLV